MVRIAGVGCRLTAPALFVEGVGIPVGYEGGNQDTDLIVRCGGGRQIGEWLVDVAYNVIDAMSVPPVAIDHDRVRVSIHRSIAGNPRLQAWIRENS